jgi:hypothetical protein
MVKRLFLSIVETELTTQLDYDEPMFRPAGARFGYCLVLSRNVEFPENLLAPRSDSFGLEFHRTLRDKMTE